MSLRQDLRALDSNIVRDATSLLYRDKYSCIALFNADARPDGNGLGVAESAYVRAFELATCKLWWKPYWWNSSQTYYKERSTALADFAEAIDKAKLPTLRERLVAWLTSPCEVPN